MPLQLPKCDNCDEADVQFTCTQCNASLCQPCDKKRHSKPAAAHHQRQPYSGGEEKNSRLCTVTDHEDVPLTIFCQTCWNLICSSCMLEEHKTHKSISLKAAVESLKSDIKDSLLPIQATISKIEGEIKVKKEELKVIDNEIKVKEETLNQSIKMLEDTKNLLTKNEMDAFTFVSVVSKLKREAKLENTPRVELKIGNFEPIEKWFPKPLKAWKLLYRWSTDGKTTAAFHAKCDGKGPTVTIVRTNSGHVFGGYANIPWTSTSIKYESRETFLFSLTDGKGRPPYQCVSYQNFEYALRNETGWGPVFGYGPSLRIHLEKPSLSSSHLQTYKFPETSEHDTFLAGKPDGWDIEEIEIYLL